MRIALVLHGFPPHDRTEAAHHRALLGASLARLGHDIEVFAMRASNDLAAGTIEREERASFAVTWFASPDADLFERWLVLRAIEIVYFDSSFAPQLARRAAQLAIPTVLSANDFSAISPRATLLAPDLTPLDPSDTRLLARCDLADRYLDRLARLGDRRGTVSQQDLEPRERADLEAILRGDPREAGVSAHEFQSTVRTRRALETERRDALSHFDLVLAPTEFMARKLRTHGVRAPIEIEALGIDVEPFARTAPPRTSRTEGPLRFGFVGALVRDHGIHVLLDAFDGLAGECELSIHGDSEDSYYVERLGIHAARVGARMEGPFDADAACERIETFDVLVLPSIAPENTTFAICGAFAAHRPVIASRVAAMEESVRDGVDGLLVTPNNPNALRAALRRCIDEKGLVASLAECITTPRTIDDEARALAERCKELRAHTAASIRVLPASVQPFADRWKRVQALAKDDVVAAAIAGIARLRSSLSERESAAPEVELLRAIDRTRIARRAETRGVEVVALTTTLTERDATIRALEERVANVEAHSRWMVDKLQASERARVALERDATANTVEIERVRADLARLTRECDTRDVDITRLAGLVLERTADASAVRNVCTEREAEIAAARRALDDLRTDSVEQIAALTLELRATEARAEELAAHGARARVHNDDLERELEVAKTECALRREALENRERELEARTALVAARDATVATRDADLVARAQDLADLQSQLAARETEIENLKWDNDHQARENTWRESEMQAVRESLSRMRFGFVGRELRERALAWALREKRVRRGETRS